MSSSLPSPNDDYAGTDATELTKAVWNAVFGSIGGRLRALEAVQADFEELISIGTGQALTLISENVAPHIEALRAALDTLNADVGRAEDAVATLIASGGVTIESVPGLAAALAGKASAADLERILAAAPGALDTFKELADALGDDPAFATTIINQLAQCLRVDVDQAFDADHKDRGRANLGIGSMATRALTISSSAPSGGNDGDVWYKV